MKGRPLTLVGVTGFEPAASSSRTTRATKLRHTPVRRNKYMRDGWCAGADLRQERSMIDASGRHAKRTGA